MDLKPYKTAAKLILPPLILQGLRKIGAGGGVQFRGNYSSWQEALSQCGGYDSQLILNKVSEAVRAVQVGQAEFERDSVLFFEKSYPFPVLSSFLGILSLKLSALREADSTQGKPTLRVLDFGGSLGSSYYQCRGFLKEFCDLDWCVVEQINFVQEGRKKFATKELSFHSSIDEATRDGGVFDILFLSSVLQYLEKPFDVLNVLLAHPFQGVVIDRTPVLRSGLADRITVQSVPKSIYEASYPAWFFEEEKLIRRLSKEHQLICRQDSLGVWELEDGPAKDQFFFLLRN